MDSNVWWKHGRRPFSAFSTLAQCEKDWTCFKHIIDILEIGNLTKFTCVTFSYFNFIQFPSSDSDMILGLSATRACLAILPRAGHFLQEPSRGAQLARNYRGSDVDAVPQPKCTIKRHIWHICIYDLFYSDNMYLFHIFIDLQRSVKGFLEWRTEIWKLTWWLTWHALKIHQKSKRRARFSAKEN